MQTAIAVDVVLEWIVAVAVETVIATAAVKAVMATKVKRPWRRRRSQQMLRLWWQRRRWNCFCGDDGESGIRGGKGDALEDGGCELNRGERFKSISMLLSLSRSAS